MREIFLIVASAIASLLGCGQLSFAYPPAVGILGKAENCLACHLDNGPWNDERQTIIDLLDQNSLQSLMQADGTFMITARRGEVRTLLTVIGRKDGDTAEPPYRNAWLFVDPQRIQSDSLSKFATGWEVNLPMACRIVGDELQGFEGGAITALPMRVRPGDDAKNAELRLQVMLTKGESVKGKGDEGMTGNYFERVVHLKVIE